MGILLWIIFGAFAGWITSLVVKTDHEQGLIGDILLGIVGAIVGGWIFSLFGEPGVTGFNLYSIIVSVLGAMVVVFIKRKIF